MSTREFLSGDTYNENYINGEDFKKKFQSQVKFNDYSYIIPTLIREKIGSDKKDNPVAIRNLGNQINDYLNSITFDKLL